MNQTCVTCKHEGPEAGLIQIEGKWVCRDVIGCEYRSRPWKNPYLSEKERKKAREDYLAVLKQELGE